MQLRASRPLKPHAPQLSPWLCLSVLGAKQYGARSHATELKWKYYNPMKAPKQTFWKPWSLNRQYPGEELPWVEKTWKIAEALKKHATGYTLQSFSIGSKRFYDNVYDVLVNGGDLLITIPQVRKQIALIEEAHRQNPELRLRHRCHDVYQRNREQKDNTIQV